MENEYTVTTVEFNAQGHRRDDVKVFPKSREGLEDAYKFAQPADEWMIWYGEEVIDQSE